MLILDEDKQAVMGISPDKFYSWKHDPVTVKLMEKLKWFKEFKKQELLSPNVIRSEQSLLLQREYLGSLDMLDLLLDLRLEDLFIPEEDIKNVDII